jgi:hypothetical protein
MGHNEQRIANEIVTYIRNCRCSLDSWYVGVTSDPLGAFQKKHNISPINSLCTCREVSSPRMAREIVSILINLYGVDGKIDEDEDGQSIYVYAFNKR